MISVPVVCRTAVIYFNGGKIHAPMAPLSPSKQNRLAYDTGGITNFLKIENLEKFLKVELISLEFFRD